jgi:FtsZ-binding cell division protein ZapB
LSATFEGQKMDIINILGTIKGKVLDASNFDLLKHAYEHQNQNIVQLKDNNDALHESNELLKQKIRELSDENTILKETVKKYKNKIKSLPLTSLIDNLSEIAVNILELYISNDTRELWEKYIMRTLPFSKIQVQAGIDELCRAELISSYSFDPSHGREYTLTEKADTISLINLSNLF